MLDNILQTWERKTQELGSEYQELGLEYRELGLE